MVVVVGVTQMRGGGKFIPQTILFLVEHFYSFSLSYSFCGQMFQYVLICICILKMETYDIQSCPSPLPSSSQKLGRIMGAVMATKL